MVGSLSSRIRPQKKISKNRFFFWIRNIFLESARFYYRENFFLRTSGKIWWVRCLRVLGRKKRFPRTDFFFGSVTFFWSQPDFTIEKIFFCGRVEKYGGFVVFAY